MFRKLLKYEFGALCRDLLPIYLLMIVAAIITKLLISFGNNLSITISFLVLGAICIAATVLTLVTVINRFQKNLLKNEGYLMFTLPVSVSQIIGAKLLTAVIWCIFGVIAGLLAGTVFISDNISFSSICEVLSFFGQNAEFGDYLMIVTLLANVLVYLGIFVLAVYFAFSAGQLVNGKLKPGFVRSIIPFLCFIGFYILYSLIWKVLCKIGISLDIQVSLVNSTTVLVSSLITLVFSLCIGTALFFMNRYLLSCHLNLE